MNMYDSLEFSEVRHLVAGYATFSKAVSLIEDETVSFNPLIIKRNIRYTKEALDYLRDHERFGFADIKDISNLLQHLDHGLSLTSNELLAILEHNVQIKRLVKILKDMFKDKDLNDFVVSLAYDEHLIDLINKNIDQNGEVRDDATSRLKELRRKESSLNAKIQDSAQRFLKEQKDVLQEAVVYHRDGRTCFLIRNSDKNRYDGYSHGISASGQAAYIEPRAFVEMNNALNEVEAAISEEIKMILSSLSYEASKHTALFYSNLDSIMHLDAIFAKAAFGNDHIGIVADLGDDLTLEDIAHPLIPSDRVIKNSYHIKKPIKGIIISGSNTGGKTVSLKVIGLSILMTYLGIPLIASQATVPLYDRVFDDIDDNQSLIDSLSTFSSRLLSLDKILNDMTDRSLILIDEIASGTDPKEGEALALSIIERFRQKGATFVITTHFTKVKEYALEKPDIMISSQEFDNEKLLPTYRYIEDSLGNSNALDIAGRYLKDKTIIDSARIFYQESQNEMERALKTLEAKELILAQREAELNESLEVHKRLNAELDDRLKEFKDKEEELYKRAKVKAERYLEKQKAKIREIAKKVDEANVKTLKDEVEKRLEALEADYVEKEGPKVAPKVGDHVKITSTGQVGKLIDIKKDRATVDIFGISIKTDINDLIVSEAPKKEKPKHKDKVLHRPKSELLLVGKRVEEALVELRYYLDEAYGAGLSSVKIIHGTGTGALKSAIWQELKKIKYIKSFHYGDAYDGSSNVTIVELK